MPVTQRKRSMLLFRKLKFTSGVSADDETELNIDKMMLHCLDCLGALQCVLNGHYDIAKSKVFWGAVNTIAEIGIDSLSGHMERRHPGASQLLRAFPNDAKATDGRGWLPLHWAAVTDNVDVKDVRNIARADPLATVKGFNQPISANPGHLIAAVRDPNMAVVKCLYDFHPRMASAKDNDGDLPLHYAARYSESAAMIKYLLQANPAATKVKGDGYLVPLQCALYNECEEARLMIVHCLLEADPSAASVINGDGDTALHLAIDQECDHELIKMLINAYPEASKVRNDIGLLPLHVACYIKNPLRSKSIVGLLIQAFPEGVTIEATSGHLPAHYAAEYSSSEVLDLVLSANPLTINSANDEENSNTPLIKAVLGNNESTVRFICERYPNAVLSRNQQGRSAFHIAAEGENENILKVLYNTNPECVKIVDNDGRLPIHAFASEHQELFHENCIAAECLKFLLQKYPQSSCEKDILGYTPYSLCNAENNFMKRSFLYACPALDIDEFRRLNYAARRTAIFLAFAAINADGIPTIFCRLRVKDIYLLRTVVSYL